MPGYDRECARRQYGLAAVRASAAAAVCSTSDCLDMDGWQVLKALKADPATAQTPVVVVTMLDERRTRFELGAADYLVKPVSREDVLRRSRASGCCREAGTLLVIDDYPLALKLITAILEPRGWTVLSAGDGETGTAMAKAHRPSVVLLDLLMPGIDGFAVAEALRSDPATRAIPIVVLYRQDVDPRRQGPVAGTDFVCGAEERVRPAVLV